MFLGFGLRIKLKRILNYFTIAYYSLLLCFKPFSAGFLFISLCIMEEMGQENFIER